MKTGPHEQEKLSPKFESSEIQRIMDPFLKKRTVIIDFFEERAASSTPFDQKPDSCKWCDVFRPVGLRTCLNCGTDLVVLMEGPK